jgi:DNA-binding CsgD family transcriptional regulator/tetratricopeptide (TPR) repeat protein
MNGAIADSPLVGRPGELGRLRGLIDSGAGGALVVLGEAGIGKSALLTELAGYAQTSGLRVVSAAGQQRETSVAFAGLLQLLRPVLVELLAMRGPHAGELRAAIGLAPLTGDPNLLRTGSALLELLAGPGSGVGGGVVVLVDDAQWLDRASLDVLAFAAHRLETEAVTMVFAVRGDAPPPGLDRGIPELHARPLSVIDAGRLLAAQPHPPQGCARAQVLAQAAGNPLALIELARAVTADPGAGRGWIGLPLPLTGRLSAVFAERIGVLPAATRHALLSAAVADGDVLVPGLDPEILAPAEELGLVTVDATGVRFRHPLTRSAVYHAAPFASRAATHRRLADLLVDRPGRRAWHLAAAALHPDEDVASLLAAAAADSRQRGEVVTAAFALERAADLSPRPADEASRLVAAAETAVSAGQTEWAGDLATRALGLARDASLRSRGQHVTGWALARAGRYLKAAGVLLPLVRETASLDPAAAWNALGLAATAAYQAGDPELIRVVADTLAELPAAGHTEIRLWVLAVCGRTAEARELLRRLPDAAPGRHAGAAAWLLDQTTDAIDLLHGGRDDPAAPAASGGSLAALGWAYLDAGRWDEALQTTAEARGFPGPDVRSCTGALLTATIEAARGNTECARALIADALAADPEQSRLITARAQHASGLCALADGDCHAAFEHLRPLFDSDGAPYHPHASYLAVGDLALAAARSGHRPQGQEILERISARLTDPSPRVRQLLIRADGILADPSSAGAYPTGTLGDETGDQWPFERAQLRLELGEWLRRRRRINEAKPVLSAAFAAFRALRARPWELRAEAELRACGIAVGESPADPAGLRELTPQQRQIIRLAATGLSNREIAQRLFLSPRTVSSHLYRSFPKLGVAGRHQLHSLLVQADNNC